jgi:anti-sigma B factor antagonist
MRRQDGIVVLSCRGDLDAVTAPRLDQAIDTALDGDLSALIVDLSGLDFLASRGMTALVRGHVAAAARAIGFGVVANGPTTSRPMELVGLNHELRLHPTLDAALASTPPAPQR